LAHNLPVLYFLASTLELPNISKYSPHLAGVLKRAGMTQLMGLDEAFAFALEHGAWMELDFEREEGVPYNPRPARVALILINDAKTKDLSALTAGVLATAHPDLNLLREKLSVLPSAVTELAILALSEPELLIEQRAPHAGIVACALHLDRARHRHLVRDPEKLLQWKSFVETTERYQALADKVSPELGLLLAAWLRRARESEKRSG